MKGSVFQYVNQNFYGYLRECGSYVKNYTSFGGREPETKFVVFGRGRSGSTLLVSLLNSCPDLYCDEEILNRRVFSPFSFVNCRSKLSGASIYGFKLLSYQLRSVQNIDNKRDFIIKLGGSGYKFIFLVRENRLRQCLSKMYAAQRSTWHESKAINDNRAKMTVDLDLLLENLKESERLDLFERELMEQVPHLYISYEKDLLPNEKHGQTVAKIADYLNAPHFSPSSDLKRITSQDFSSFIDNSDEMINFLIANNYEQFVQ